MWKHDSLFGFEGSSFYDLVRIRAQDLLSPIPVTSAPGEKSGIGPIPHGTTILALKFDKGVIIAGDRRATEGYQIAGRRIEKVYACDRYSAVAIAGAAGPCIEMARLFQTELEHYEKLEGMELSMEGKANKLGQMIKGNLPFAMQGLVVIPIFAGYDLHKGEGRIFKYDVTGGRYEEIEHYATGSGGKDARNTLKKRYQSGLEEEAALRVALEALYDAAEEDVGTGGPDMVRGIYPTAKVINGQGIMDAESQRVEAFYRELLEQKNTKRSGE